MAILDYSKISYTGEYTLDIATKLKERSFVSEMEWVSLKNLFWNANVSTLTLMTSITSGTDHAIDLPCTNGSWY